MTKRHAGDQSRAALAAPVGRRHVGLDPGLIDENQTTRIDGPTLAQPLVSARLNVRTVAFGGRQGLFFRVICSRSKNRRIEP